jgi:hypothetical protein
MEIQVVSALLCDDIRQEFNGKLILIGCYTGEIVFPKFPASGQFTMMACLEALSPFSGSIYFRFLVDGEVVGEVNGDLNADEPGRVWAPVALPPVSFPGKCALVAEAQVEGTDQWHQFFRIDVRRIEPAKMEGSNSSV